MSSQQGKMENANAREQSSLKTDSRFAQTANRSNHQRQRNRSNEKELYSYRHGLPKGTQRVPAEDSATSEANNNAAECRSNIGAFWSVCSENVPGAGSGNRTHASTLGRSQAAITSYPRSGSSLPPGSSEILEMHGVQCSAMGYVIRLIARASTIATVMRAMIASAPISALACRLNGMTSVGLKAVALVNARYK
jgi:hypothetical protein